MADLGRKGEIMSSKIVVAGVASLYMAMPVDGFPVPFTSTRFPDWMRAEVAGAGCHIASTLRWLGDDVRLCTLVGQDPPGIAIREALRAQGLMGTGIQLAPESSLGVVMVGPGGLRCGNPYLSAVNMIEYPAEVFLREVRKADLAVLTNAAFVEPLLEPARRAGIPIAVDVHLIADTDDAYNQPWLEVADIIFCSHEKLSHSAEQWITDVFGRYPGCAIVAVGLGARGCLMGLRDGRTVEIAAAAPRGVANTSGAGDALFSSFLHAWLATADPVIALGDAVLHAGWKVGDTFPGACSLTQAELDLLRRAHPLMIRLGRWDTSVGD
jgi:sugar/nucleoside kinase (ribokinase family)